MTVYPNPVKKGGGLNIALAGSADAIKHIVITNEIGQEVFSYEFRPMSRGTASRHSISLPVYT
jgi:hypothetical protein